MTDVRVRHPGISVVLRKNVGRSTLDGQIPVSKRFDGQRRELDLTPLLGDQGRVVVRKSIREPAGSFSITIPDQIAGDNDTLYGLVEPMDVVEIRMAGDAFAHPKSGGSDGNPQRLPIMMRGLVSRVERSQAVDMDGRPHRAVTITGQDYGKIWQILQVFLSPFIAPEANLITSLPFFAQFGAAINTMHAEEFVKEVFAKVVNPFIDTMKKASGDRATSPLLNIQPDMQVADGVVSPFGIGGWQGGTIYALLQEHCDIGPWNELYIEDREDGPFVVYRPNPFIAANRKDWIMPVTVAPAFVNITREDVVSMSVARSDENVANYFWVDAPRFALNFGETVRSFAYMAKPEDVYVTNHGNVDPTLYGNRRMWAQTQQGGRGEVNNGNGTPDGAQRTLGEADCIAWMARRREQLVRANLDNVVFETGSMAIRGNEAVKAGAYVRLENGGMFSDHYVTSVTHDYLPFQRYLTQVEFERGTGFIDRVQREGGRQSPYWAELVRK